jgi:hypothetical protein
MTKRIAKFITPESEKNTAAEARNSKRDAALKAINAAAALEDAQANFVAGDKPIAPPGVDEFGMPILPTPKAVIAMEAEATRITNVPPEAADGASETGDICHSC